MCDDVCWPVLGFGRSKFGRDTLQGGKEVENTYGIHVFHGEKCGRKDKRYHDKGHVGRSPGPEVVVLVKHPDKRHLLCCGGCAFVEGVRMQSLEALVSGEGERISGLESRHGVAVLQGSQIFRFENVASLSLPVPPADICRFSRPRTSPLSKPFAVPL